MSVCEGSVTLDQIFPFSIYTGIKAICWVKHSLLCPVVNLHLMRNFYLAGWSALSAEHRRWRVDPTWSWTGARPNVHKIVQIWICLFFQKYFEYFQANGQGACVGLRDGVFFFSGHFWNITTQAWYIRTGIFKKYQNRYLSSFSLCTLGKFLDLWIL